MSTINELKAMNEKELCMWSSKTNAKELKAILKDNGFRGYSKMKKAELLNAVLDMIISDEVEVEVEVVNNEADNVPSTMFIDEIEEINVQQEIRDGLNTKLKVASLFSAFHDDMPKKSEEQYIKEEIESQKKEYETKIKDVKENKDLNRVANELNECFLQLGSGLRAEVITTRTGNYIRNNLYIYAKGVCMKCYDADFYLTKLDKFISKNEEEDSWFDDVYDTDDGDRLSQRDILKEENKLDILYIYGLGDDRLELPLYVEPLEGSLIEYRIQLLNDKNVDVDMSCKDWFDVSNESGWIDYDIEVDEFLAINRARKGQKINFVYMSEKAMSNLYDKASVALIEVNNIKLLK